MLSGSGCSSSSEPPEGRRTVVDEGRDATDLELHPGCFAWERAPQDLSHGEIGEGVRYLLKPIMFKSGIPFHPMKGVPGDWY